jgi:tetratricopeptide (TPR) repeat protein
MRNLFVVLILFTSFTAFPQAPALRGPEQVMSVLQKSSIDYRLAPLKDEITSDNSHKPNPFGYYRVQKGGSFVVKKDEKQYNKQALDYRDQAEAQLFIKNNAAKARELYQKALALEPELYTAMSGVGQTYAAEKDYSRAEAWYQKAIALNYMDSYTHRLLARTYKSAGKQDRALKEITIALVLDRRHQSVIREWKEFYKAAGLSTAEWSFIPQIRITKQGSSKVLVEYKDPWLSYALAKAAWSYEPGFREAAGVKADQGVTMVEEFECVYNLAMSLAKVEENQKLPPLKALEEAVWNSMVYEFIFFEIVLPRDPFFVYQIPNQGIEKIADYVLTVRGKLVE